MTQISKIYRDPSVQKDEWTSAQNSNNDWMIIHNGRVVKVARTEGELKVWWDVMHPNIPLELSDRGKILDRAIGRL